MTVIGNRSNPTLGVRWWAGLPARLGMGASGRMDQPDAA
jgi:hypothetical protein